MTVFALSPGPGVVAVVSTAVNRGFWYALALGVGLVLGDQVFLLFAAFGLSLITQALGDIFIVVCYLGAAHLVWLGVQVWRAVTVAPRAADQDNRTGRARVSPPGSW